MHFEPKDGGFFLRSPQSQGLNGYSPYSTAMSSSSGEDLASNSPTDLDSSDPTILNTEHFTVLPSSQPVSIRVMYGPFSTKQTVPIRLLVPDPLDGSGGIDVMDGINSEPEMMPPLDLSAHIVTPTVPKDTPILRVLFHAGQTAFGLPITPQNQNRGILRQQVCTFFLQ
jgi:transmembrane protein 132